MNFGHTYVQEMFCIVELQGKLQNKKENPKTQEKRELRAGEEVCFMEEEKKVVGAQDKMENEKTVHLVRKRKRNGEPRSPWQPV